MRKFSFALAAALAVVAALAATANASKYSSTIVSEPGIQAADPALVVAPDGAATVAWTVYPGPPEPCSTLRVARIEADGTVGPAQAFPGAGACARDVDLAVDRQGRVTAVWQSSSPDEIQMSRIGSSGTPGPARTLGSADQQASPRVAVDRAGRTVVVYRGPGVGKNYGDRSYRARAVQVGRNGALGAPIDVSQIDVRTSELAIDGQGRAIIAWSTGDFSSKRFFRVQSRTLFPDGSLGPLRTLSNRGQRGYDVALDISSAGKATVAWHSKNGIFATRVSASGRVPRDPQNLSGPKRRSESKRLEARSPEVAVTRKGSIVAWTSQQPDSHYRVERSGLSTTGKVTRAMTVATASRGPELIARGRGAATIGYVGIDRGASIAGIRLRRQTAAAQRVFDGRTMGLKLAADDSGRVTAAALVLTPEGEGAIGVAQPAP